IVRFPCSGTLQFCPRERGNGKRGRERVPKERIKSVREAMLVVFKPFGLHPAPLYWLTGATAVLMLVLSAFMLQVAVRGSRLEYRLDDDGLTIVWGRGITVPYGDIEEVRRMEGQPRVR